MSLRTKATIYAVLASAVLIAAAAVTVTVVALSDGRESGNTDRAAGESPQVRKEGHEESGQGPSDSSADERTQADDDTGAGGGNPADSRPGDSATTSYPDLAPMEIPASSVDEALLRQAAVEYMAATFGDTQAYQITQIKISAIDPNWGKVTFYRQDQDLTVETLFYRQNGNWAPAQIGPGTPAMPTDL